MNKYFVYDPEYREFETFATKKECDTRVKKIIDWYTDEEKSEKYIMCGIVSGVITHQVQQTNYEARPDNLDEDGRDEDGIVWESNWGYMCNYENLPLKEE